MKRPIKSGCKFLKINIDMGQEVATFRSEPRRADAGLPSNDKLVRAFLISAALILLATGLVKAISALQEVAILSRPDPLFQFLTNRQLLLLAAGLEVAVAALLLWNHSMTVIAKSFFVLWLSLIFLAYRMGLWWIGYEGACSCLGNAAQWVGAAPSGLDMVSKVLLGYLLVGSSFSLVALRSSSEDLTSIPKGL